MSIPALPGISSEIDQDATTTGLDAGDLPACPPVIAGIARAG